MEVDNGGFASLGKQELHIGAVVLKKRFSKHGRADGLSYDVEVRLIIGVAIAPVGAERNLTSVIFTCLLENLEPFRVWFEFGLSRVP